MSRYDLSPVFGSAAGVFMSLSAWCTVYLVLSAYGPRRRAEWHCRVTTVIHAVLICCLSAYACLAQGPWPFTDPGGPNTPLQRVIVIICLGYFLFDFAWCLAFGTEGITMLCHHALTIMGLTVTLFRGYYGTEIMASMFGTEISNPLLQLRWFLRETGRKGTRMANVNDFLFISTFGLFRIVLASYLLYIYLNHPVPDLLGKFGGCVLYSIGVVFWMQICAYAYRKLFCRPKQRKRLSSSQNGDAMQNGVVSDQNGDVSVQNGDASVQNGGGVSENGARNDAHDGPINATKGVKSLKSD